MHGSDLQCTYFLYPCIEIGGEVKPRVEHWCGKLPNFAKHLRTWGEAGVVKTRTLATNKIQDRGEVMMFVGYNVNMGGDVLRMWCERTKRIHCTRDITWLNVYYFNRERKVDSCIRPESTVGENADDDTVYSVDTVEDDMEPNGDSNNDDEEASVNDDEEDNDNDDNDDGTGNQVGENDTRMAKETVFESTAKTRSGRVSKPAAKLGEWAHVAKEMQLEGETKTYLDALLTLKDVEFACVGAGVGGGFDNTSELKPMKYKEAMATKDKKAWELAVEKEHDNMTNYDVWTPVKLKDVPKDAKVLTSTWAMKKKANGTFRARLNARGYEEIDGVHYDSSSVAAPVTNELTIRICMTLMLMAGWMAHVLDVKGAFLRGEFEPGMPPMYMKVPEGFEKHYGKDTVLRLLRTIYGLKEAAAAFWKQILKAFDFMGFSRSKADPCLYYKWTAAGYLMMWLSWVDDCVCFGRVADVSESAKEMNEMFECEDIGNFEEYVGCKVERKGSELKMTQPVLIQSFEDEFDIDGVKECDTPATTNSILAEAKNDSETLDAKWQTKFRSGVGKLLHMMRWSRPEIYNAVRDLSKHGGKCTSAHIKAMKRVMKYCVASKSLGWKLKPERKWDGKDKSFEFRIKGKSDSDFACDPSRRSVTGLCVFLEGVAVSVKSVMQKIVALSVTEAETIAAVQCAQEMMLTYKILTSMGLKVELPMILEVDNKGAVDLANNWSHGGRTKHMEVRNYWLRELKEQGLLKVVWTSGADNAADIFTKNLPADAFKKHRDEFVG